MGGEISDDGDFSFSTGWIIFLILFLIILILAVVFIWLYLTQKSQTAALQNQINNTPPCPAEKVCPPCPEPENCSGTGNVFAIGTNDVGTWTCPYGATIQGFEVLTKNVNSRNPLITDLSNKIEGAIGQNTYTLYPQEILGNGNISAGTQIIYGKFNCGTDTPTPPWPKPPECEWNRNPKNNRSLLETESISIDKPKSTYYRHRRR